MHRIRFSASREQKI